MRYFCCALAGLCLTLAFAFPVSAASVCEPPSDADPLAWLIDHEAACRRAVPEFNLHLGRLLNEAGRFLEAADRLEASLLENPASWMAKVEYAIALEGSGDVLAAASLLTQLAKDTGVPKNKRQEITSLLLRDRASSGPRNLLTLGIAHDDNLYGDITQDSFELTLPDGRLPVALSAEQRPKGGLVALGKYRREASLPLPGGSWRYAASAIFRGRPGLSTANLTRLGLQLERRPEAEKGLFAQAGVQYLARGGDSQLLQRQLMLGYEHAWLQASGVCRLRGGVRAQKLSYPSVPELDGRLIGPVLRLFCDRLFAELSVWRDQPAQSGRPGGAQSGVGVRLGRQWEVSAGALTAEYEHVTRRDAEGYSPLLEDGSIRKLHLNAVRLEYRWPGSLFSRDLVPFVAVDWLRQRSNLPLFGLDNRVFTAGVRLVW